MILKKILNIKLISSLVSGSGEGWGNVVDIDSTHDRYGFPYIPAKRIKGVLREAAQELADAGYFDKKRVDELFGNEEGKEHHFVLYDAVLDHLDEMKDEIRRASDEYKKYFLPINVLNEFTNVYYQTAVEGDGIVKEHSLRTVRAIDKDTIFKAYLEFDDSDADLVEAAISIVHHMGINRTRGYGEVELSLDSRTEKDSNQLTDLKDDQIYRVKLCLCNKSQLSMVSSTGEKGLDYIPGSSLLGYFANRYIREHKEADEEFYRLFVMGDIKFSNAYISDENWNRYEPVRESLYKEKTGTAIYDKIYEASPEGIIVKRVHDKYKWKDQIKAVKMELSYHHKRPEDKSVGHVISNDLEGTGIFYQREVIAADQRFVSFITAAGKDLKKIFADKIPEYIQVGSSRSTQFGNVKLFAELKDDVESIPAGTEVVCTLQSPLILLDEKGESVLDIKRVAEQLNINISKSYAGYTKIGGFNSKWKLQKPFYAAFSKGSCFRGVLKEDMDSQIFAGDFTGEGLGEIKICPLEMLTTAQNSDLSDSIKEKSFVSKFVYMKPTLVNAIKHENHMEALRKTEEKKINTVITKTLLGRLLKMLEKRDWGQFEKDYRGIADKEKQTKVNELVSEIKKTCDDLLESSKLKNLLAEDEFTNYRQEFYMQTLVDLFTIEKVDRREV